MCIMEVTPGQRTASIAMAMAHNLSTVDRDLDMFRVVLEKRGEHEKIADLNEGQRLIHEAYQTFLSMFGESVGDEIAKVHAAMFPHEHGDNGNERAHDSIPNHTHNHDSDNGHTHDDGTTHTHDISTSHTHDSENVAFSHVPDSETADVAIVGKSVEEIAEHYARAPRKYMTR